ncbi:MAG TPA: aminopeptidase [Anaerolineales bacterium]|nr:aminopeptidase [Anaerolineales bacterium]HNF35114.1 aminopeptidase [Anaerolineales bacterium]
MNTAEFQKSLEKYADVIVKVGINLRKGQNLTISASITDYPLVRAITKSAYASGAKLVTVFYGDDEVFHTRMKMSSHKNLTEVPSWIVPAYTSIVKNGDAYIGITSDNPDLLADVDPEAIAIYRKTMGTKMRKLTQAVMRDAINWCVISYPAEDWAKKVFPKTSTKQAQEKLWEAIFKTCRVDQRDPVAAWEKHIKDLSLRSAYLNKKRYAALHYKAPGTDLTVGLPSQHKWVAARSKSQAGIDFTANLPTEEVFTMPHKDKVDGFVAASRPLVIAGTTVEDFTLTFEKGRVVKVTAKKHEETLRKLIETDEGAARLGEVALVPNSSPISQSGILFYNTLFDENASSHIALGAAYPFTMKDGNKLSQGDFQKRGGNHSIIHTDFMIGSKDMDIDGILANGKREPLMRKGEWAFKA